MLFDEITIDADEMPPDVVELFDKMTKLQEAQQSLAFSTRELALLAQAVGGMRHVLRKSIRSADETAADGMLDMLTDASLLEKRLESAVKSAFASTFGPEFNMEAAMDRLKSLSDSHGKSIEAKPADTRPGFGFGTPGYL